MSKLDFITPSVASETIDDSNHFLRRFFRCWIDGSYNGEGHYHANCDIARRYYHDTERNNKRLRAHVISEWSDYIAAENDCSVSTVQRRMVAVYTRAQLESLNDELIDDLRDLVRYDMEGDE